MRSHGHTLTFRHRCWMCIERKDEMRAPGIWACAYLHCETKRNGTHSPNHSFHSTFFHFFWLWEIFFGVFVAIGHYWITHTKMCVDLCGVWSGCVVTLLQRFCSGWKFCYKYDSIHIISSRMMIMNIFVALLLSAYELIERSRQTKVEIVFWNKRHITLQINYALSYHHFAFFRFES